ncbi:MAG: sialidase family protein [Capsulimonadales bacterium]|nr:sialidase family protein [Capsulimonadales bacterium]
MRWNRETSPVPGTRCLLRRKNGELLTAHPRPTVVGRALFCFGSADGGKTWKERGAIATDPDPTVDLGDGMFLETKAGQILHVFRRNHYAGGKAASPDYAIEVAFSKHDGHLWQRHSVVTGHTIPGGGAPSRGLWAPSLLETASGRVLCVYDDEKTPYEAGFRGHQWLMLRTWNARNRQWENPTVVSRANDAGHLSRDGMGTMIELAPGRLLCALESVRTSPPHANLIRSVRSDDDGKTWSWQTRERETLYQPSKANFMALSPMLTRLKSGRLVCIFCTDEDRERPDISGTPPHRLNMDVKAVTSVDGGRTWSASETVAGESHRTYLPGLVETGGGELLATWIDFAGDVRTLGRGGREA